MFSLRVQPASPGAGRDCPVPGPAMPCLGAVSWLRAFGRRARGFTLIELLVVVALVGIVAAIAYPSYIQHISRTARSDGMAALMDTAQILERCYTQQNTYDNADCQQRVADYASPRGLYEVALIQIDAESFTLEATPQGVQATRDGARCASLRYDHTGARTATGSQSDRCWN